LAVRLVNEYYVGRGHEGRAHPTLAHAPRIQSAFTLRPPQLPEFHMPKSKTATAVNISDQLRFLAETIQHATVAHDAMNASMKKIESLCQKIEDAASKRSAAIEDILRSGQSIQSAKLRALDTAFNTQYLKIQMHMQRENQIFTSVSNVLKTRHDTAKNSIGNIR
jgi:uncharacterized protein YukE